MKKILIVFGVVIGTLFLLILIARVTGLLGWYVNPTPANEPTLKMGRSFLFTSLKTPARGNFIVYKNAYTDSTLEQGGMVIETGHNNYVKRLCGMPGDMLQMKNGVLFVNGENFDRDFVLKSYYITTYEELGKTGLDLDSLNNLGTGDLLQQPNDTVFINLDDKQALVLKKQITIQRHLMNDTATVFKWMGSPVAFTVDNWGPIKVPADSYFVLGDNRQNSLDSRFFGFVNKKSCQGTVLWK